MNQKFYPSFPFPALSLSSPSHSSIPVRSHPRFSFSPPFSLFTFFLLPSSPFSPFAFFINIFYFSSWIFSQLPQSKQMIVTSATYPKALDQLLSQYMRSPTMIQLNSEDVQLIGKKKSFSKFFKFCSEKKVKLFCEKVKLFFSSGIKQFLVNIDDFIKSGKISTPKPIEAKLEFLVRFFASVGFTQCLVFCNFLDR